MTIIKVGEKFRLVSKRTGKNLGTYDSKAGAEKRERQVQYFKHMKEEVPVNNVSGGQIAGTGVGPQGEPGVKKKKNGMIPFMTFFKRKGPKVM